MDGAYSTPAPTKFSLKTEAVCSSKTLVSSFDSTFWKIEAVFSSEWLELTNQTTLWKIEAILSPDYTVSQSRIPKCHVRYTRYWWMAVYNNKLRDQEGRSKSAKCGSPSIVSGLHAKSQGAGICHFLNPNPNPRFPTQFTLLIIN
jgi:hypothetical protein